MVGSSKGNGGDDLAPPYDRTEPIKCIKKQLFVRLSAHVYGRSVISKSCPNLSQDLFGSLANIGGKGCRDGFFSIGPCEGVPEAVPPTSHFDGSVQLHSFPIVLHWAEI